VAEELFSTGQLNQGRFCCDGVRRYTTFLSQNDTPFNRATKSTSLKSLLAKMIQITSRKLRSSVDGLFRQMVVIEFDLDSVDELRPERDFFKSEFNLV